MHDGGGGGGGVGVVVLMRMLMLMLMLGVRGKTGRGEERVVGESAGGELRQRKMWRVGRFVGGAHKGKDKLGRDRLGYMERQQSSI